MSRFDAFCGPFNTSVSPNITSELTMNWIPERNPISIQDMGTKVTDKNVRCSLIRTPGLQLFQALPASPVRGLFPGEQRLFAAAADRFYEVTATGYIDRSTPGFPGASGVGPTGGPIGNDGQPVQAFFNGNQVLIISAGQAYCDNGNGPVPCQFSDALTDLLIDPADGDGTTLTTPTGGMFDASDVGRMVQITGGYGFNLISQVIISVDANGGAKGASTWGIPGSGLGTGIEWLGQMTLFDLQLVTPFMMHSDGHAFGPSDIGIKVHISSGTGWVVGDYTVTGLVYDLNGIPNGNALLDRNAGVAGATNGVGDFPGMMVTASQGALLDGYFFVVPSPRTKTVYFSAINDGKSWNPLDFFVKGNYPDNVAALIADHQELYTMGNLESTQVWRDVGNADNPFAPDPGAVMHIGCQATWSVVRLGNGVAWIGEDVRRGTRRAYHATGYNPVVVSTPAVEAAWAKYSTISDAVAFTMMDQGHENWIISFPTANATWAYDATTGWWHPRGFWNGTEWDRIRTWVHCVAALGGTQERHYAGDWSSGNIYVISSEFKTDNGSAIVRRRRAPHLTVENMRRFYARFEIDCDVLGQQRVFWNRLGDGRDRIWQLDTSQSSESGPVTLTLSYSDDRTQTFQTMFPQSLPPGVDVTICNAYLNETDATWH